MVIVKRISNNYPGLSHHCFDPFSTIGFQLTEGSLYVIFRLENMEINWLGHSCFRLKGSRATVITDPYSPDLGYTLGKTNANVVTVSHQHPGHSNVEAIGGEPKVVAGPGEYEISGVLIIGMPSYHDENKGEKRGKNTIYLLEIDEMTVCHLGDLGHTLSTNQAEELDNIDILMVPVGGVSTIDAIGAAEIVRQLEPKVVIPMHYKTDAIKRQLAPVDKFLNEMGIKDAEPQTKINFTKSNLPLVTQVYLLDY
jgi:L-ascorbate metabolism protein UlaG (beta-lactamase superfamily)